MALPHLIKFVYNNGTDEVIRRGKKIHSIGYVELVEHDDLLGSVTFRVKDDSYATYYKVYIQKYKDPKALSVLYLPLLTLGISAATKPQLYYSYRNCWIKTSWAKKIFYTTSGTP